MRPSFFLQRDGWRGVALAPVLAVLLAACTTAPPTRTDINQATRQAQSYENKRVQLTGLVKDFRPAQGDIYRTLVFTLAQPDEGEIMVAGAGYTAEAIARGSLLVERAYEEQEPLTVTGKLKLKNGSAPELQLESVSYKGQDVKITRGPSTRPGISFGGGVVTGSIGIGATISP